MPSMQCAQCGRPNSDGARFCSNCGAPLVAGARPAQGPPQPGPYQQGPYQQGPYQQGGYPQGSPPRPGETTSTSIFDRDEGDADLQYPDSASVGQLPPGTAELLVMRGPNAGSRFRLDGDLTTAGRHPDSDIFLDDVTVSRRHAEFYREGGRFTVRDVGSLNGTYVNGARIEEAELVGGAEVQIGKFRLQFFSGDSWGQPMSGGGMSGERYGRGAQGYV
jgi:FHA domain-containing protein/zinc ribbon protein